MRFSLKHGGQILTAIVAGAGIAAATSAGAEEALRWKFKVGEKLNYHMVQEMWLTAVAGQPKESDFSWDQFNKDCGPEAQKTNSEQSAQTFREKYKDKNVSWFGQVDSVSEKPSGGYEVVIRMDPLEPASPASKIRLNVPMRLKGKATALKKDNTALFTGPLVKLGSGSASHEVEAATLAVAESMNFLTRQEIELTWDVQGVDEKSGEAVIRLKFDRVRMKMTPPISGFEYDSKAEVAPGGLGAMIAPMYKAITDGEFEITMTARGEVKDVKIPDEVLAALKNSPAAAEMGSIATAEGFKKMIAQGALVLPNAAPKSGETWTANMEMDIPSVGVGAIVTTYRYEGNKQTGGANYAVIRPQTKMNIESKPAKARPGQPQQPAGQQPVQVNIKEQNSSGEVLFNINDGRLQSTSLKQNIRMEVSGEGEVMQQKIDQKIDVKVTAAGEGPKSEASGKKSK